MSRKTPRSLDEYLSLPYPMEVTPDPYEGGYTVSFPDLPGCLTSGDDISSALKYANEAKREWLRAALDEGIEIHEPNETEDYSGQFKLRMPKSLHRDLAMHARREGVSMNQYCVYLLSRNDTMRSAAAG